jgi:hypothetical protein
MAKFHYVQRQRKDVFSVSSAPPPVAPLVFTASRQKNDTYVRSVWTPRFTARIDLSGTVPVDDWWASATLLFTASFSLTGSTTPPATEDDASVLGIIELYPRLYPGNPGSNLTYVTWEPLDGPTEFVTARKGNNVNFPTVISTFWPQDHFGVFTNGGSFYSMAYSYGWRGVVVWASDHP